MKRIGIVGGACYLSLTLPPIRIRLRMTEGPARARRRPKGLRCPHAKSPLCWPWRLSQPMVKRCLTMPLSGELVEAGVGVETIVAIIKQPGKYTLSSGDTLALKKAGVSDKNRGCHDGTR